MRGMDKEDTTEDLSWKRNRANQSAGKKVKRVLKLEDTRRHAINKICSGKDRITLVRFRYMYGEHKSTSNLKKMTVLTLGYTILFRGIDTTGLIKNAMGFKIGLKCTINIFSAIVTPKDFNGGTKLSKHHLMECLKT
ncbi:hypothetical protein CsSME_00045879 [Camellia sinensis var. sinensis]